MATRTTNLEKNIKSISKDTLVYGVSGASINIVTLVSFPLLARNFTVIEFGQLDLFFSTFVFAIALMIIGQDSAIFRFFNDECNSQKQSELISRSLGVQIFCSVMVIFIFFCIPIFGGSVDYESSVINKFGYPLVLALPFGVLFANAQAVLRLTFQKHLYVLISCLLAFGTLIVYATSAFVFEGNIQKFLTLYVVMWVVLGSLSLWLIRRWIMYPTRFVPTRSFIAYALPMGGVTLIGSVQPFLEKILVAQLLSVSSLGLYAAALKVAMVMSIPISAFQQAFAPYMMATFRNSDAIHLYNLALKVFLLGVCCAAIFLAGFGEKFLVLLAGKKYVDGHVIIFPLAVAALFQSVALFIGVGTILSKNTFIRLLITSFSVLLTISFILLLVPKFDVLGVAIGIATGKLVLLFLEAYSGNRLWPLQWDYKFIVRLTVPALMFGWLLNSLTLTLHLTFSLITMCFVFLSLIFYFSLNENEGLTIIRVLQSVFKQN